MTDVPQGLAALLAGGGRRLDYYMVRRHPALRELGIDYCYLCGKPLPGQASPDRIAPDHIIPDRMFEKGAGNRPQLPTHEACNNAKSKDDQWFKRVVEIMCSATSPQANAAAFEFFQKAARESESAYIIGSGDRLRSYKLFRQIVGSTTPRGLQVTHQGQPVPQLALGEGNAERLHEYLAKLCQGLFVRNVPGARPELPLVQRVQYIQNALTGEGDDVVKTGLAFANAAVADQSYFWQRWGDRMYYMGSRLPEDPNKGFVILDFYRAVAFLALFP